MPGGVAVDVAGNVYVADTFNQRIRKITPDGVIRTIAGTGQAGYSGDGGPATAATLFDPYGIAVDSSGNIFVADYNNDRVRKINPDGLISTVAGNGVNGISGDGGPATLAQLSGPSGVAVDGAGNLFVTDYDSGRVRKITTDGRIQTVAGVAGWGYNGSSGVATSVMLAGPWGIAVDAAGNLYVADSENGLVRKITPGGQLTTIAGSLFAVGPLVDSVPATAASLLPAGIAVDSSGNLYIVDLLFSTIRKVIPGGSIATIAGNGQSGFSGHDGPAVSVRLAPYDVAVDPAGNVFIADFANRIVRKVERRSRLDFNGGRDFNGDRKSDIAFRDAAGNVSNWLLNGYSIASDNFIANIWTGWTITGVGDFNADGKSDILWRDIDGNVATWLMNGATVSTYSVSGTLPPSWTVAGVGDFNGDGKADILWREKNGDVAVWLMNGHAVTSARVIGNIWIGWTIEGVGDFSGDGRADILWRDTFGNLAIWLMDGVTVSSYGHIGGVTQATNEWAVAGIADFDGDGASDILWRQGNGQVFLWLMNGYSVSAKWLVATIYMGWTIVGVGDFNGDIRADIVWGNTSGDVVIWQMDGPTMQSFSSMGNVADRKPQ